MASVRNSVRSISVSAPRILRTKAPALRSLTLLQHHARKSFHNGATWQEKKFTQDHEWIELDTSGSIGTIGISKYAAKALGDVVYVELPQPDTEVSQGEAIGAVESVKSASDILSPAAGTITESNSLLEDKPGTINADPEGEGWIAKIHVKTEQELDGLMNAAEYDSFTGEEEEKSS